ncbi:hypothetical protein TEA_007415 [Camellia sinensis var. sinensis]|uniref:ELMO domain-containing protein n=1 Tax=Camellia sinensis var. sinensis TaxID=542762 RepID=A0A4S4ED67_CAMSN|nr:hypothetical protein TEA_007415 [Camellia sinensis var. sinensis]
MPLHVSSIELLVDEDEAYWRRKKASEELAWSHNSAHVISQLTQCFTNAMVGPRSWIGGIFSRSGNRRYGNEKFIDYHLSPLQASIGADHGEKSFGKVVCINIKIWLLQRLQERLYVPFDETRADHQKALRELWCAAFPDVSLRGLISEQWKDMGWQGANPSTDFRGCGFISLENLLFFARSYPDSFHRLLFKKGGKRATWEYPFAVAGINVSFMLIQMLELDSGNPGGLTCLPIIVLQEVLRVTRTQLERELSLEDVNRIQDLPAYNLLYQ